MQHKRWMALVSSLALVWSGAAGAQENRPAEETGEATASGDDAAIVVTAQRRAERLVDVPISVATAGSEDLERAGASSLENLTKITPGVYLQRAVYGLSPTVRGIGSTLAASGGEQNVALYVDEIYYPTPTGNVFDLASVAGVEVLKGPQGTLFGRNATGGAILVRTLDPGFELTGRLNISYERFDQVRSSAYVNVPISDAIAVNGSVAYRYSRGHVRDLKRGNYVNRGDNFTARGKLLLQPTDDLSVVLTAAHADFDDPSGSDTRNFRPAPIITLLGGAPIATGRYEASWNSDQVIRTSTDEISGRIKLDTSAGTLSSFTSFLHNKLFALNELDLSYINTFVTLAVDTKTFTQEVNFASTTDKPLSYVVGLYYFRNRGKVPLLGSAFLTPAAAPLSISRSKIDAIAGYADGTYSFGDFSIIAGVRFSHERRRTDSAVGVATPPYTRMQRATESEWTPRVGFRYAIGERTNVYGTYSKGFKSGVFDATTAAGPGVRPETVDAFELGFKSASRDFSFNAAAFHYDYANTQVNATVSGQAGAVFNQLFNVPKSRIYGIEADFWARLGNNFDVKAAAAYTRARYIDFKFAPGYVSNPADPATLGGLLFSNVSLDVSGNTMVRAPEFTASSTLSYHTEWGSGDGFELALSPYYSSRVFFTFDNSLSQKAYFTLDATATLTLDERLKISIFGRNLTDSKHMISMSQNSLSLAAGRYAMPMTYGVSFGYSF